ncbi:hypothetical protein NCCP2716_26300 [Sporosarcina sp. NCCP-2716]|uniref:phosphotransferase n=1 Tax=Sporosarcina sp. NCCP-2716 TaxID=2943679 RepID=UPI00203BC1EE|nr:phosphotransferase [Sporosarcina sp. NCCP-2716]GKV70132.1 hypothetical protein NCCP2716_26300 [Sporosarcina sp. NCCP-2716]
MEIQSETIDHILAQFGLTGHVSKVHKFIDYYDEVSKEVKIIAKVEFADRAPLIMKILRESEHPMSVVESQSAFSEYIRSQGIRTARRYASDGHYCLPFKLTDLDVWITVEEDLGEEIQAIDFRLASQIGQLLGKIHAVSEKGSCLIGRDTIFNFLGYNEVSGYDVFCELGETGNLNPDLFQRIQALYKEKLDCVKRQWKELPRFATQGDMSINNLTCNGGDLGIFDFNIAGDATLVADMVLQGLLTANEMPLAEGTGDDDRPELFMQFVQGYCSERELSKKEKQVVGEIQALSAAFWFTTIRYNDDSLEQLVERHEQESVTARLKEIYNALRQTNLGIFNSSGSCLL